MEKSTPFLISVTGWSGSGKTTFCERLITELISRGYKTAAAKNTHEELQLDKPGSDSSRFSRNGAQAVCLNAANSMAVFYQTPLDGGKGLIELFKGYDFIVAEGFKTGAAIRIEITGTISEPEEMKNPLSDTDLLIYGNPALPSRLHEIHEGEKSTIILQRDDISTAADIICSRA